MKETNQPLRLGLITTSRADYSIYRPLIVELLDDSYFAPVVLGIQTKTFASYHGTYQFALSDKFPAMPIEVSDSQIGSSQIIQSEFYAEVARGLGRVLEKHSFDLILCLGDRYEMYSAAGVVPLFGIPIVHLYGGEVTEGAVDEKYRHAISKLSDYHFTSCEAYRQRVIGLGAHPESVFSVGSLGAENLLQPPYLNVTEIQEKIGVDLDVSTILVTLHPATAEEKKIDSNLNEFCKVLESLTEQVLITLSNSDVGADKYNEAFLALAKKHPKRIFAIPNLGTLLYKSVLKNCSIMLGNSSSGIIEAASFNVVVVNVGNRQQGRATSKNTIPVGNTEKEILEGLNKAKELVGKKFSNVYFQENVSSKIINILKKLEFEK